MYVEVVVGYIHRGLRRIYSCLKKTHRSVNVSLRNVSKITEVRRYVSNVHRSDHGIYIHRSVSKPLRQI